MKRWVMKKKRIVKKDGRYLIYYRFEVASARSGLECSPGCSDWAASACEEKPTRKGVRAKDV